MFIVGDYVADALSTWLLIYLLEKSRKPRGLRNPISGDPILEVGLWWRIASIALVVGMIISTYLVYYMFGKYRGFFIKPAEIPWVFLLASILLLLWLSSIIMLITSFGLSYRVTRDGLEKYWFGRTVFQVGWNEIDVMHTSTLGDTLIITTSKGKMRLSLGLDGLRDFADAVKDSVPREKWVKVAEQMDELLSEPGVVPEARSSDALNEAK